MKRLNFLTLLLVSAILLSSCGFHTGLGNLVGSKSGSTNPKVKHIKATHTPPSPPTGASASTQTPEPSATSSNAIAITNTAFQPNNLQITAGTTVTWTNNDTVPHRVTSDTNLFDSGPINAGSQFTFTFTQAGTFTYKSTGDSALTGTITVTP